jgi:lipopolysaccharide biosynthesis glycosyltransferase
MKTCFVTSFDKNYFYVSMVMAKTLGENHKGPIDLICMVPRELLERQKEWEEIVNQPNLNVTFKIDERFEATYQSIGQIGHITSNCMYRLYFSSICDGYDRAIYIDPDTIIIRDVSPMIDYEMYNYAIIALQESSDANLKVFNTPDMPYFNNGVFIANLNLWKDLDIENKLLSWQAEMGITRTVEQDAMNAVLAPYWGAMPISFNYFNYQEAVSKIFSEQNPEPLVVHFVGGHKPWNKYPLETAYEASWIEKYKTIIPSTDYDKSLEQWYSSRDEEQRGISEV